jgi:hypothetical protein
MGGNHTQRFHEPNLVLQELADAVENSGLQLLGLHRQPPDVGPDGGIRRLEM